MVEEETRLVRLVHYTAKDILERLIMETFPQPHALVSAVCLAQLTDNGFQQTTFGEYWRLEEALETKPLLGYAYSSWFMHAPKSLANPLTKSRLIEFVENCHAFPIQHRSLNGRGFFDVLGLLHLVAYFNLSTAFAGCANVRNPNQRTAKRCLTGLHLACMQGHDDAVKQLLQLPGLSVNAIDTDSLTALIWASDRGNEGVVRLLLAHPDISVNALDAFGGTALIWASRHGHKGVVTALLSHPDTNVNMAGEWSDTSALIAALDKGHGDVVVLFLSHPDINVNAADRRGRTALSIAAMNGDIRAVKLLLSHLHIDVNVQDKGGYTPLRRSMEDGRKNVVELLIAHPAIRVSTRELELARAAWHYSISCLLE